MINTLQLRDLIIVPTLKYIGLYSDSAVNLLLGTCAQESGMGEYLHQVQGPAQGPWEMEPATENLCWSWLEKNEPAVSIKIRDLISPVCGGAYDIHDMVGNLFYACAMARVLYLSIPEVLPEANDIDAMANYWKQYYNRGGKGTVQEFKANYAKYVTPYI